MAMATDDAKCELEEIGEGEGVLVMTRCWRVGRKKEQKFGLSVCGE